MIAAKACERRCMPPQLTLKLTHTSAIAALHRLALSHSQTSPDYTALATCNLSPWCRAVTSGAVTYVPVVDRKQQDIALVGVNIGEYCTRQAMQQDAML